MERFIFFPKNEFYFFNEGKKCFKENNYKKAIMFFEKAIKLKYLKRDCIKYLIDCHIELHNYDEVYKMIEDEFVDKNVDEEYLLKKYIHTMVLDEQYIEASEIIKIYMQNNSISLDLREYLEDLLIDIDNKLNNLQNNNDEIMLKYLTSNKFDDQIQVILNLEQLNYKKYEKEVDAFINNANIDSFVKYSLIKYLFENNIIEKINYTNFFNEKFLIYKKDFVDLLEDKRFNNVILNVLHNIENDYITASEFIKNIWLDFSIKHYPKLIDDINLASCILHGLIYKSLSINYNLNDLCKTYNVSSKLLFKYFEC